MTDAERSELMDEIDAAAKMPTTADPIAALIEADKRVKKSWARGRDEVIYARAELWQAITNAMPAIVTMVEEVSDLRHKEGELASELQRTREVNERLRAELAECRKDAERYRWLRVSEVSISVEHGGNIGSTTWMKTDELDQHIDAALAQQKGKEESNG